MDCEEVRVDMRALSPEAASRYAEESRMMFGLNSSAPGTDAYNGFLKGLFGGRIGEGSTVSAPLHGAALDKVRIGRNVFVNSNCLMMARGGITIEDDVMIAANVQLLSNNHDLYERAILVCRPILVCKGAWIGAGATVLPGVRIGKYAVVGACAVVTKDVPDYAVVVGSPARAVRMLDPERFVD